MRRLKILLALSLVANLLAAVVAGVWLARRLDQPEPVRIDYSTLAEARSGLPGASTVIVGDSLVADGQWSELLGYPVASRGMSGARIGETADALPWTLPTSGVEQVIVWVGANDAVDSVPITQIGEDYDRLFTAIDQAAPDSDVLALLVPPVAAAQDRVDAVNDALAGTGAQVLDVSSALAPDGNRWHDGIHITGVGYVAVAELLVAELD